MGPDSHFVIRLTLLASLLLTMQETAVAQIEPQPHRDDAEHEATRQAERVEPVLTRMPELLVYADPEYTLAMREEGLEGEVVLLLTISAKGLVTDVEVIDSPDPLLSAAAKEAALGLEFQPAEIDHEPAPVQIEFGYVFSLDVGLPRDSLDEDGLAEDEEREPPPASDLEGPRGEDEPHALGEDSREATIEERLEEGPPDIPEAKKLPVTLTGRALVRGRRDPIEGAMVVSGDEVATTDSDGYFELRLRPEKSHVVSVRASGFHHFETNERIEPGERHEVVYYVQPSGQSPYETVVRATRPRKEVSRIVLSRDEAQRVPGTFGDPLRVIENLPGMARSSFIGGQLLVRGSRPEDSGVYFDGVGIPILYHFGGLTSVVNAEFIEDIDFMPGGFGAEYGRASAGIVDVTPRRLIGKPARGAAKIDIMDTSLFYRRPIGQDMAVGLALRRSYVDLFLPFFLSVTTPDTGDLGRLTVVPVYTDYQVKVDWTPSLDHELDLFVFGSRDTLELVTGGSDQMHGLGLDAKLSFHRVMISHQWRINPDLALRTRLFGGLTLQGAGFEETSGTLAIDLDLDLLEAGLRQDLSWWAHPMLTLRTGLDLYGLHGFSEIDAPIPSDMLSFPSPMQPQAENQVFDVSDGAEAVALWAETILEPSPRLQIVPGLRLDVYRLPEATWPVLEPRLSSRFGLLANTTLKAAAGIYHKAPTIIEANPVIGNPAIRPERARHLVLGVEQVLTDVIDLDVQLFHNKHTDLVVSSGEMTVEEGLAEMETFTNRGEGQAYGAELLIRHKITPRAFGWLAYTLMRSERRSSPDRDYVPASHDQTHILTLVGSYRLGRGFEVGARFRLVSGNPYTPVIDSTHDLDTDNWRPVHGPTRSARMPTFHQLDLRAEYTRTFDTFTLSAFLDLLNTYNQANVEGFQYDYRYRNKVRFNGLPLMPVLGARGQW